jgi:hypothetical protein
MPKNKKVMSMAIQPELHDKLKLYARRKNMSVSEFLGDLVEKSLRIDVDEDPFIVGKPADVEGNPTVVWKSAGEMPVVLKIPVNLKGDREGLQKWMEVQTNGIVTKLCKLAEEPVATDTK